MFRCPFNKFVIILLCQGGDYESKRQTRYCFQEGCRWSWLVILLWVLIKMMIFTLTLNTRQLRKMFCLIVTYRTVPLTIYFYSQILSGRQGKLTFSLALSFNIFWDPENICVRVLYVLPWVICHLSQSQTGPCQDLAPVLICIQPLNILSALWSELSWWNGSHLDPNIE